MKRILLATAAGLILPSLAATVKPRNATRTQP